MPGAASRRRWAGTGWPGPGLSVRVGRDAVTRHARALAVALGIAAATALTPAAAQDTADWASVEKHARGQVVDWYAWGGETHINDFIAWAGTEVAARYGVTLRQVKVADTSEAVARVVAETTAGRTDGGAVDLIWINGENFVALKGRGLLRGGAWAEHLPNRPLVDLVRYGAAITSDFGLPVEGEESPWGRAQLVFIYDGARTSPPATLLELVEFAASHPGRFTYPQPPDFVGTAFLKQLLVMTLPDPSVLARPAGADAEALVRAHLLPVLSMLHPHLWRSAAAFPPNVAELRRLFSDGELDLALTFNPSDAAAGVAAGLLPPGATVASFAAGSLGNVHFVAIPNNSGDAAGAMVVANFLLSPEAQARKADVAVWGDPTVLDVAALEPDERALFGAQTPALPPTLPEPHASWTGVIERVWADEFLQ